MNKKFAPRLDFWFFQNLHQVKAKKMWHQKGSNILIQILFDVQHKIFVFFSLQKKCCLSSFNWQQNDFLKIFADKK